MDNRARNELIGVLVGLAMIITGVCLFISKTSISSEFLQAEGDWEWWSMILVFVPLLAGIVLSALKPRLIAAKIVAVLGAFLLIAVIMANSTIIIEKRIMPFEWILYIGLMVGGLLIFVFALFAKKRK